MPRSVCHQNSVLRRRKTSLYIHHIHFNQPWKSYIISVTVIQIFFSFFDPSGYCMSDEGFLIQYTLIDFTEKSCYLYIAFGALAVSSCVPLANFICFFNIRCKPIGKRSGIKSHGAIDYLSM